LLFKDVELGKAVASAQKAEAASIVEVLKPVAKRPDNRQRRKRWPKERLNPLKPKGQEDSDNMKADNKQHPLLCCRPFMNDELSIDEIIESLKNADWPLSLLVAVQILVKHTVWE
jgi:hypothetical protein